MKARPMSVALAGAYLLCGVLACLVLPKYQAEASAIGLPFLPTLVLAIGPIGWLGSFALLGGIVVMKDYRFSKRWLNVSFVALLLLLVGSFSFAISKIPAWEVFMHDFHAGHEQLTHASAATPERWEAALRQCTDLEGYAGRALAMAESHPASEMAQKQLWWVIFWCPQTQSCKEAVEIYCRDYPESVFARCRSVASSPRNAFAGTCLQAIARWSSDRQMRAQALLWEARFRQSAGESDRAESLYGQIISEFGDVNMKDSAATLGELAQTDLKELQSLNSTATPLRAGEAVPHFEATLMDGSVVQVPDSYKGKLLLIDFWATWCVPCVREIPNVVDAYAKYHTSGFEVLTVSLDKANTGESLARFIREHKMSWPQIYDGKYLDSPIARRFGIGSYGGQGIPYALLIDGDTGLILAAGEDARGPKLNSAIAEALAKWNQ